MRNPSLAQAPKSTCLQRSLQNGRKALAGLYTLSPPQVGHTTVRERVLVLSGCVGWVILVGVFKVLTVSGPCKRWTVLRRTG